MLAGFFLVICIFGALGAGGYVYLNSYNSEASGAGAMLSGLVMIIFAFVLSWGGSKLGWWEADMDDKLYDNLTYDSGDYLADNYGIKAPFHDYDRAQEVAAMGLFLSTFQFLFGTLWGTTRYLTGGVKLPEEALRGATGVALYLDKAGRASQSKIVKGLSESGLQEAETLKGLGMLRKFKLVVGNNDVFLLTQEAKDSFSPSH